jgi:hypothetical protein
MNPNRNHETKPSAAEPSAHSRPLIWVLGGALLLAGCFGAYWKLNLAKPDAAGLSQPADGGGNVGHAPARVEPPAHNPGSVADSAPPPVIPPAPAAPTAAAPAADAVVDPAMRGLVAGLITLSASNSLSPEQVQAWSTNFSQLVQAGAGALPALRAFLAENRDVVFDTESARALGFRSARLAAFDALRQIGGADAIALMDQTLTETKTPREIAVLAWNLNGLTDGQYREQALAAARRALATASAGAGAAQDMAPIFEVFQHYGDAGVTGDLEQAANRWKDYAMSTLASLPEHAGVPALIRMANTVGGGETRLAALQMLAQVAVNNADARSSLLGQMSGGQIPPGFWAYLSSPLAGDQLYPVDAILTKYPNVSSWNDVKSTHINFGNQNYYSLPGDAVQTADGINLRLGLLDQCLAATTDPAARQALQQASETLNRRLAQLNATSVDSTVK